MQQSPWEIVILKPSKVFLSFLATQLPYIDLPDLKLLQSNTTAYAIHKHENEEETLDEIEKHFPTMFRHEISRWVRHDHQHEIEGSFLDFLCCFKFELHSQIVLMEPTFEQGHQLLCVKPKSVLLKWMKTTNLEQNDSDAVLERINLSHLTENATVVVKNFKRLIEIQPFIQQYYRPLFKAEMMRMANCGGQWPTIDSLQSFNRYFSMEFHTQLIHLH